MRLIKITLFCLLYYSVGLSKVDIVILSQKPQRFSVEVAKSDREQAKGLMFRQHLPQNEGMLFVYAPARPVSMWMKNTYISLDMLFINTDGEIMQIYENTIPMSLDLLSSQYNTAYVLEINAGLVNQHEIKVGQRIELFDNSK